jgi:hypothetical protein
MQTRFEHALAVSKNSLSDVSIHYPRGVDKERSQESIAGATVLFGYECERSGGWKWLEKDSVILDKTERFVTGKVRITQAVFQSVQEPVNVVSPAWRTFRPDVDLSNQSFNWPLTVPIGAANSKDVASRLEIPRPVTFHRGVGSGMGKYDQ